MSELVQRVKLFCTECQEAGLKSRVRSHGGRSTLIGFRPYHDGEGAFHSHDPNISTSGYSCSNGHTFTRKTKKLCPAPDCEYGEDGEG